MSNDVAKLHERRNVSAKTEKAHAISQAQFRNTRLQVGSILIFSWEKRVTDDQSLDLWQKTHRLDEYVLTFPCSQPAEYTDNRSTIQVQFSTQIPEVRLAALLKRPWGDSIVNDGNMDPFTATVMERCLCRKRICNDSRGEPFRQKN